MSLIRADARALPLRDGCVQCVVTSPPYFGLRDYGIAGQIGLEPTPDAYVAALVGVFREVRRVLRDDGVCWLNLGDSYSAAPVGSFNGGGFKDASARTGGRDLTGVAQSGRIDKVKASGLKPKDLVGIPWRVAFALQADGWYLRSDVIWAKRNCMPESVTDRPTRSHEYVFLLTKRERYSYNADAIRRPHAPSTMRQVEQGYNGKATKGYEAAGVQNPSAVKARIIGNLQSPPARAKSETGGSNARSVWWLPTQPYAGAHFATMPEALVEPCVLAGSKSGDLVLDPFAGSGTVVRVAYRLARRGVGCDLNAQYLALADARTTGITYGLPLEFTA